MNKYQFARTRLTFGKENMEKIYNARVIVFGIGGVGSYVVEALVNYIALLGWAPSDNQEIFSLKELCEKFDVSGLSKSPSIFDKKKLTWMNGEYIKAMDFDKFWELTEDKFRSTITKDNVDIKKVAEMVKTRLETLNQIPELAGFFNELPEYGADLYTHKKMKTNTENSLESLKAAIPVMEGITDWNNDTIYSTLVDLVKEMGIKNGQNAILMRG